MGDKPSKGFKSDGHRLGGAGQDDSSPTKQAPPPKKSVFKKKKAPPRAPIDPAERAKQAEERRRAAEQRSNAFDNKLKSQRAKKVGSPLSLSLSRTHNPRALRDLRKCRWGVGPNAGGVLKLRVLGPEVAKASSIFVVEGPFGASTNEPTRTRCCAVPTLAGV